MAGGTEKVWSEIERLRICMLVERNGKGLRARPMASYPDRGEGVVWFVTDRNTRKEQEIRQDPHVCLAFLDNEKNNYLSVTGNAEIVSDRNKLKALWDDTIDAWFPNGPDDPDVVLLKVEPQEAEFWDSPSSRQVIKMELKKAQREDRPPKLGESRKVAM